MQKVASENEFLASSYFWKVIPFFILAFLDQNWHSKHNFMCIYMQIRGRHLGFTTIAMVIMQKVALLVSFLIQITSIIVVFIIRLPFKYQI